MSQTTAVPTAVVAPMGFVQRFVGVITSPRKTFEAVAARPHWFGMLALVTVASAVILTAFMLTPVGQQAYVDKAAQGSMFGPPSAQQMQGIEKMAGYMGYIMGVAALIMGPIFTLVIAGVAFLIFGTFTGGDAKFKQVLAVVAHAGVVGLVGQLLVTPVSYFRESLDSPMNLYVFFQMLPEGSFLAKVLGSVDVFRVWWVMALSIGLAVLYRRKTSSVATVLFVIYAVLAIAIAAFTAVRS